MLTAVTGGTGFLGSHAVAALLRDGHRVRLLARERGRVAAALEPLGIDVHDIEVVVGDVRDEATVDRLVEDCDTVVNVAGVYSFDSRDYRTMREVNARSVDVVISAARRAGVKRIVHVSSVAALCNQSAQPLTTQSPPSRSTVPYMASMSATETVARRHQADGAPVVILYPPATLGPADPHLGDQIMRVRNLLKGRIPIWPTGGIAIADVRDVADLISAAADAGFAAKRAAPKATFLMTKDYLQAVRKVTGRRLPVVYVPWRALIPIAWALQWVQKVVPFHIPAEYGAIYACSCQPRFDGSAIVVPAGANPRTIEQTMTDSVRWLHDQGQLTRAQAGRALNTSPTQPTVVG